jgi:hypothetical protein
MCAKLTIELELKREISRRLPSTLDTDILSI